MAHYNAIEINAKALASRDYSISAVILAKFDMEKANDIYATLIIDTVLHELSHLEQDFLKYVGFSFLSFNRKIDMKTLENANSYRTRKFVLSHDFSDIGVDHVDYALTDIVNLYYREGEYAEFYKSENLTNYVFNMVTGYGLDALNKDLMQEKNITKVGLKIGDRFYNLYDQTDLFDVDQLIRYSFKKFGSSVPKVIQLESGEFVIASELYIIGELPHKALELTEEYIYNYVPAMN